MAAAVGGASSDNNFVSGLVLLFERRIDVGDAVQIGEVSGQTGMSHIGFRCIVRPESA